MENKEFLTPDDVAELLQMKVDRVYEAIGRKELRAFRVSKGKSGRGAGLLRIARADLDIWLNSKATRPAYDEEEEVLRATA